MTDRAFDRLHYMEAWLTGYNACRDGVPNEFDAIMARVKADLEDSGSERASRAAHSKDLDGLGQIGNSTPEADDVTSETGSQADDAMHLSIDHRMSE